MSTWVAIGTQSGFLIKPAREATGEELRVAAVQAQRRTAVQARMVADLIATVDAAADRGEVVS